MANALSTTAAAHGDVQLTGTVLKLTNYGDTHRIVDVLTAEMGRTSLLARGARASKKRFGGSLDVFARLRLHAVRGRGLWVLQAIDVDDLRLGIRTAWEPMQRAGLFCACARRLAAEHQAMPELLHALDSALDMLAQGKTRQRPRGTLNLCKPRALSRTCARVACAVPPPRRIWSAAQALCAVAAPRTRPPCLPRWSLRWPGPSRAMTT